jgi:hypothetical protein
MLPSSNSRVGRWMSPAELAKMQETGRVQESFSGTTYVAFPSKPTAFGSQAKPGSVYVEFDISLSSLRQTKQGWAGIKGPQSLDGRLAAKKGWDIPQMPEAKNIKVTQTKP